MIDRLVDQAIASLLERIPGLNVLVGVEDNYPVLQTPYCVVYSNINRFSGRKPIYELTTMIEYVTISGQDLAANVENVLTQIDQLISPGADYSGTVTTTGLRSLLWEGINRSQQEVGDRRKNIRELLVRVTLA